MLTLRARPENAARIIGVRVQDEAVTRPLPAPRYEYLPDRAIVCRCERVTVGEIVEFIKANEVRDVSQLNRITSYNVCYTKLLRYLRLEDLHDERHRRDDAVPEAR